MTQNLEKLDTLCFVRRMPNDKASVKSALVFSQKMMNFFMIMLFHI